MREPLRFPPRRSRLVSYASATGLLLALSAAMMFYVEHVMLYSLRITVMVIAFLGCITFGYGLLYNLTRLTQAQPLLEANAEGLWFHVTLLNHGKVEWADLDGFEIVRYGLGKRVLVKLRDAPAYAVKYPGLRRHLFQRTLRRYGTPVSLPLGLFAQDAVSTLQRISAYGTALST